MTDIRIIVTPPTPSAVQLPILETRVERSIDPDTLGWAPVDTLPIDAVPQEIVLQQVDVGTHYFRSITVDTDLATSPGENIQSAIVGYDAPSDGAITVTLE